MRHVQSKVKELMDADKRALLEKRKHKMLLHNAVLASNIKKEACHAQGERGKVLGIVNDFLDGDVMTALGSQADYRNTVHPHHTQKISTTIFETHSHSHIAPLPLSPHLPYFPSTRCTITSRERPVMKESTRRRVARKGRKSGHLGGYPGAQKGAGLRLRPITRRAQRRKTGHT
jgi:hypothetical protein